MAHTSSDFPLPDGVQTAVKSSSVPIERALATLESVAGTIEPQPVVIGGERQASIRFGLGSEAEIAQVLPADISVRP